MNNSVLQFAELTTLNVTYYTLTSQVFEPADIAVSVVKTKRQGQASSQKLSVAHIALYPCSQ